METWDIYDAAGNKTGRTMQRGQKLQPGDYHLVVHIWFTDTDGNTLIQKRPDHLEWVPGIWAATGGSAFAGENSATAAARETEEELGLSFPSDRFVFLKRIVRDNSLADL